MKLNCNRFAVIPIMCDCCKRYIWMEPYRRTDVWHGITRRYFDERICKTCIPRYLPKKGENNGE